MRRIIAIVSGKGGVGKTVTAINLGMALHNINENAVIIDADLNNPNIGLHLGVYNPPTTLNDILEKEMSIMEALHIHPTGLRIIPSSISLHYLHTNPLNLKEAVSILEGFALMDCAPGFGREVISSLESCDEAIVVTNPIFPSVVGCMRLIEVIKEINKPIRGIVVNNLGIREITNEEIGEICGVPVIAEIPYDRNIDLSIIKKNPLVNLNPYSPASIEFQKLAHKLSGKDFKKPRFLAIKRFLTNFKI